MSQMEPSPQTTLVILLGASEWPYSSLQNSTAFARSANRIRDYFCHSHQFGLPSENWLNLFDTRQSSPNEVDQAIGTFLDERISLMKQTGTPARDLLFYYIGHGVFAPGHDQAYHLAIRSTRDESMRASAVAMAALADTLKAKARHLRRIVILDCCFAAESFKYMQAAPDQVAIRQTMSAFEEKSKGSGFPTKGTALLCSSGHKEPSLILRDESGTMFSEALLHALSWRNERQSGDMHRSLYELKASTEEALELLTEGSAPRPFLSSPDQSYGDVASVPFFPPARLSLRKIALFGYETQGGSSSVLWNNLGTFYPNETYREWFETKKDFTEIEIVDHTWIKVGDHGYSFIVRFLPHGQLYEHPLLDPTRQLQGSWQLSGGILRTTTEQDENGTLVKYELDIIANKNGLMHSGVESNNKEIAHSYFVFLPSQQSTTKHLEEALTAFNQLLDVNQNCVEAHKTKGNILRGLGRYEEALDAYKRTIALKPDYAWAWYDKGDVLHKLERYEEALTAFDYAIEFDGKSAWMWYEKGQTFYDLERYEEALILYEQAIMILTFRLTEPTTTSLDVL